MESGKVKWFNERKGFGFIERASGGDVFAHYADIDGKGFRALEEGQEVEFEVVETEKGPKAVNIKVK